MARLDAILRRVEAMGVAATERHWGHIPPALAKRSRARVIRIGDGLVTLMPTSESLRMNRVTGLGRRGGAREGVVDEILGHYRAAKVSRFSILLGPGPQAETIEVWLRKRGFRRGSGHALLLRDCRTAVPRPDSSVRVARARRKDQSTVVRIHTATFGGPASRREWSLNAAADPRYEHYLALVGATPAGAASLSVDRGLVWLGGGATLTRWRRRGVHTALIAARLRRAVRLGCTWAWTETAQPVPGRPQGSYRNLTRLGFEVAATKPSFVMELRA